MIGLLSLPFLILFLLLLLCYLNLALHSFKEGREERKGSWSEIFWAFWKEYLGVVSTFVLLLLDYGVAPFARKRRSTGEKGGVRPPLVLIHGLGMRALTMLPLKWRLEREGREVFLFNYGPSSRGIPSFAHKLKEVVEGVLGEREGEKADLIGHSLGGVIGLYYVNHLGGNKRIGRIIALGSPFKGTELWRFALSKGGRSLRPDGEFVKNLGAPPEGFALTSLYSPFDEIIVPARYSRIEGGKNIKLDFLGHTGYIYSRKAFLPIKEALDR